MLAVLKAVRCYLPRVSKKRRASALSPTVWCIRTDNTTVLRYINSQGGRFKVLSEIAETIWQLCTAHHVVLIARHLAGHLNVLADDESRDKLQADRSDWSVLQTSFNAIDKFWGPHKVDLFASSVNTKVPVSSAGVPTRKLWQPMLFSNRGYT